MTYTVSSGTLNLTQPTNSPLWGGQINLCPVRSRAKAPVGSLGDEICKHCLQIMTAEMINI